MFSIAVNINIAKLEKSGQKLYMESVYPCALRVDGKCGTCATCNLCAHKGMVDKLVSEFEALHIVDGRIAEQWHHLGAGYTVEEVIEYLQGFDVDFTLANH